MDETVSEVIGDFYDSAADGALWARAFERLGDALGGAAFVMSAIHRRDGLRFITASRQDPDYTALIATQYGSAATNPLIAAMPDIPAGTLMPRDRLYPASAYYQGALWNDAFRPQNLAHVLVGCVLRTPDYVVPLGVLRRTGHAEFSAPELRLLEGVLPHLRKAMSLGLRMASLRADAELNAEVIGRLATALILVDARCRVVHANPAADRLLTAGNGVRIVRGALATQFHGDAAALAAAVARVAAEPGGGGETLAVRRGSGRPCLLLVAPVGSAHLVSLVGSEARALVVLNNPDRLPADLPARLIRMFGLSPAEATLAAGLVTGGKRVEDLAEERGVSANTVKTHLKAIYQKTDTSRQAELVRLLSVLPE